METSPRSEYQSTLWYGALIAVAVIGIIFRLAIFDKTGGDYMTYKTAMDSFRHGINPYIYTVESFKTTGQEHGYAYFPTLLYLQYGIWAFSNFIHMPVSSVILWKIPVLLADLLLGYLIIKPLKDRNNMLLKLATLIFWLLNPYLMARYEYSLYDPLFLVMLMLGLQYIEKDSVKTGIFYALAVSFKTIPIILLPLFLLKTPKKGLFIATCAVVLVLISVPFMKSFYDFQTYMQGSLFVHSERSLQGRPILSSVTYALFDYGVNFRQHALVKTYSLLAMAAATLLPLFLFLKRKLTNPVAWATMSFALYLLLTPVLSRTHLLWILPWPLYYLVHSVNSRKKLGIAVIGLAIVWLLMFNYLLSWNKGFEAKTDLRGKPVLKEVETPWEFERVWREKYYEFKDYSKKILIYLLRGIL